MSQRRGSGEQKNRERSESLERRAESGSAAAEEQEWGGWNLPGEDGRNRDVVEVEMAGSEPVVVASAAARGDGVPSSGMGVPTRDEDVGIHDCGVIAVGVGNGIPAIRDGWPDLLVMAQVAQMEAGLPD